jgi:molecular chaperone DnaK (HSP70)
MGAAIFAHAMAQQPSGMIAKRPVAEAVTKNNNAVNVAVVLNSSIGFRIGATGNMHVVLSKNTPLPCEHQMRIYPAKRGQNKVTVKAFRGEHQLADENTPLGAVSIDVVNDEALFLSYRVTEEGIMLVSLRDGFGITVNERLQISV